MAAKAQRTNPAAPAPRTIDKKPIPQFDRVIHEKTRLAIISALAVNETLAFLEVKEIVNTSDGNISVHARKLEEAGYLTTKKFFVGRIPRTEFTITPAGRRAFEKYIGHMEALVKSAKR